MNLYLTHNIVCMRDMTRRDLHSHSHSIHTSNAPISSLEAIYGCLDTELGLIALFRNVLASFIHNTQPNIRLARPNLTLPTP